VTFLYFSFATNSGNKEQWLLKSKLKEIKECLSWEVKQGLYLLECAGAWLAESDIN
jgi:hypothetical protein